MIAHELKIGEYVLNETGHQQLTKLGVDITPLAKSRRRYAYTCLDWGERKPHLGGALGATLLNLFQAQDWVEADLDSRALAITRKGERQFSRLLAPD